MTEIAYLSGKTIIIGFILAFLSLTGCKDSDTRKEVDSTVEEFAGKKKVDQMKKMERDIGKIQDQQSERFKQFDDHNDEE